MELQLFGINHKTSNVSERERFIINESNQILLDSYLKEKFGDKINSFFFNNPIVSVKSLSIKKPKN